VVVAFLEWKFMKLILLFASTINRLTNLLGRAVSWLTIAMIIAVVVTVISRYFFEIGSIALQESVTYLHATIFLMGIAYTLQEDNHVRVDIFYRNFSIKRKALVNLFGGVFFLIPVNILVLYYSWDYVWASWAIRETSAENNGLPFIFLLKTLIILMPITLSLQGVAEIIKSITLLSSQNYNYNGDTTDENEPIIK
jgi:TRAP-type mannitol/chloroaromatic compound transport system permease small subunit